MALNVCTHAVPSNDAGETASRLAMQAAALESDNQDPLGHGRIDTTVLGLVSAVPLQTLILHWTGLDLAAVPSPLDKCFNSDMPRSGCRWPECLLGSGEHGCVTASARRLLQACVHAVPMQQRFCCCSACFHAPSLGLPVCAGAL